MWLLELKKCRLDTGELVLYQAPSDNDLEYTILSHRWEKEEVLFAYIATGNAMNKAGYDKISQAIRKARNRKLK